MDLGWYSLTLMAAVTRNPVVVWFWRLHRWIYRRWGGWLAERLAGPKSLLLTTIGRRSGAERHVVLNYVKDGTDWVVVGSYAGEDRHPSWFLNLTEQPNATIKVGRRRIPVQAEVTSAADRKRLYRRFVEEVDHGYETYLGRTTREIPVVRLIPSS